MFEIKNKQDFNRFMIFLAKNNNERTEDLRSDLNCLNLSLNDIDELDNHFIMKMVIHYFKTKYNIEISSDFFEN